MRGSGLKIALAAASIMVLAAQAGAENERRTPYWASIAKGDAIMRAGPERTYPAVWRYRRADLPVLVTQVHKEWRRIREVDGTEGWMLATLLSARRTAMVTEKMSPLYAEPTTAAPINWRAEAGVVGRLSKCIDGWCRFDANGKRGYVKIDAIWGIAPGETVD